MATSNDETPTTNEKPSSLIRSLTTAQKQAKNAFNNVVQRSKKLLANTSQQQQQSGSKTDESDVEGVSTASTAIEDAMVFCAADEAACSQYANGTLSATEYHKMLAHKLGASLSTDGQAAGTVVIRSARQQNQVTMQGWKRSVSIFILCASQSPSVYVNIRFISEHSHRRRKFTTTLRQTF